MGLQFAGSIRNAMLDQIQANTGSAARLRIYSGTMPANCLAASTGTLLADMTLPTTWMDPASGAVAVKTGTWSDLTADATGTAGYFRIFDNTATICGIQGECTDTAGAGPMKLSTLSIVSGEPVTVSTFSLTAGNA